MLYGEMGAHTKRSHWRVLILIFLENALRHYQMEKINIKTRVLILIFLENALRHDKSTTSHRNSSIVLILIFLENALRLR